MKNKKVRFELEKVFLLDAADIVAARNRSLIIHHSSDIDAAGDEVETAVRQALAKRLPNGIHVGHGHIIDSACNCSGQLDVVIADSVAYPIFFQSENGTEYFPYESVYALGEVRSSYQSPNDVSNFVKKTRKMKETLKREETPTDFISTGRGRGFQIGDFVSSDRRPFKNPLFSFMLFVNSKKFSTEHIKQIYQDSAPGSLPNILCFLDRGIIAYAKLTYSGDFAGIHYEPQFASFYEEKETHSQWIWLENENEQYTLANNLGWLYFTLSNHIQFCTLTPPDLMVYAQNVLTAGQPKFNLL